jgi:hypothetical protein
VLSEPLTFWCASSCQFLLGIFLLTVAILRHGRGEQFSNRRLSELIWQSRSRNTDWWLDINRRDDKR